jgi:hypothetical protein
VFFNEGRIGFFVGRGHLCAGRDFRQFHAFPGFTIEYGLVAAGLVVDDLFCGATEKGTKNDGEYGKFFHEEFTSRYASIVRVSRKGSGLEEHFIRGAFHLRSASLEERCA